MKNISSLTQTNKLDFDSDGALYELTYLREDEELVHHVKACFELQKKASMKILSNFKPYPEAAYEVSPQALEFFLQSGDDRSDIRTHSHISNCIVFHAKNFENSVLSDDIIAMRKRIDQIVSDRVKDLYHEILREVYP